VKKEDALSRVIEDSIGFTNDEDIYDVI